MIGEESRAMAMARDVCASRVRLGVLLLLATVAPCARCANSSHRLGGDIGEPHPPVPTRDCVVQGACHDAAETRKTWTVSAAQPVVLEVHGVHAQLLALAVAPGDTPAASIEVRRNKDKANLTKYELQLDGKLEHVTLALDDQGFLSVNVLNSAAQNHTAADRAPAVPIQQMTGENVSNTTTHGSESGSKAIRVKTYGWRLGDLFGMITKTLNHTNHSFAGASCTQVSDTKRVQDYELFRQ